MKTEKEVIKWMKEHKILNLYFYYLPCDKYKRFHELLSVNGGSLIFSSFRWDNTFEGFRFWRAFSNAFYEWFYLD